jgi:hypothetical protein
MVFWHKVGQQIDRIGWLERAVWIVLTLGGTTVMTVGPYEIAVSVQGKFILLAVFLLVVCAAGYYRLSWARPASDEISMVEFLSYLGTDAEWAYRFAALDDWKSATEVRVRDLLARGELTVMGRPRGDWIDRMVEHKNCSFPIDASFWRSGGDLNWVHILCDGPNPNDAIANGRSVYEDVTVAETDVRRIWGPKNALLRALRAPPYTLPWLAEKERYRAQTAARAAS